MLMKKFKEKNVVLGTWLQIPSPLICEIVSFQNLDWIAVDMEHTDIGYETLTNMFLGLKGTKTVPLVRVRTNNELDIRRALDIGAMGIIVPLIETASEARKAVKYCKYPPKGVRGHAFCRANNWGENFNDYAKTANDNISVFVMIESRQAVENIEEIVQVEGLDGVFIGPYDMSASYGVIGEVTHPLLVQGFNRVLEACKKYKKIAGLHIVIPDPKIIEENIKKGFRLIAVGIDTLFIINGIKDVIKNVETAINKN